MALPAPLTFGILGCLRGEGGSLGVPAAVSVWLLPEGDPVVAQSRLCLICGAVVDTSKITVHRQFHGDLDRMVQVTEDLKRQVKRLESRLKRSEEALEQAAPE